MTPPPAPPAFATVFRDELADVETRRKQAHLCADPDAKSRLQQKAGDLASNQQALVEFAVPHPPGAAPAPPVPAGNATPPPPAPGNPVDACGLVGLSLSGGGIRSATFNLGVMQALHHNGIFAKVDYLSTVSGGGYIGASTSSYLSTVKDFPFQHKPGAVEPAPFQHLRDHARYLAPQGWQDRLVLPVLFLRGLVVNLVLFLPYLFFTALLTVVVAGPLIKVPLITRSDAVAGQLLHRFTFTVLAMQLLGLLLVLYPLINWAGRSTRLANWNMRLRVTHLFAAVVMIIAGILLVEVQPLVIYRVVRMFHPDFGVPWTSSQAFWSFEDLWGLMADGMAQLNPVSWFQGGAVGSALAATGNKLVSFADPLWSAGSTVVKVFGASTVIGFGVSSLAAAFSGRLLARWPGVRQYLARSGVLLVALVGVAVLWFVWLFICYLLLLVLPVDTFDSSGSVLAGLYANVSKFVASPFFLVCMLVALVTWIYVSLVDINQVSLHAYYRDRLSKAYLFGAPLSAGTLAHNDTLRLSELDPAYAPYHLINTTLNLRQSSRASMRGRDAGTFVLSRRYVGSPQTQYCPTLLMEEVDPYFNLGTAVAVSGAAVSPNRGTGTSPGMAFILALLNIRLGYWIPNPRHLVPLPGSRHLPKAVLRRLRPGPLYLVREMLGAIGDESEYVNLSDGGHLENLGLYELLRRRCRWIVAADAEQDPERTFGGLIQAIRLARIDLGIDVDIDLAGLKAAVDGTSPLHCAFGTIHYSDTVKGELLYIKASVTGDENLYMAEYRRKNPKFPHQSTTDQFFDEAQFEAYRALGFHIVKRLWDGQDATPPPGFSAATAQAWLAGM